MTCTRHLNKREWDYCMIQKPTNHKWWQTNRKMISFIPLDEQINSNDASSQHTISKQTKLILTRKVCRIFMNFSNLFYCQCCVEFENFHICKRKENTLYSPTTFSSMNMDWVGWIDNWHSYNPLSSSRTDLIRNDQCPICRACSTRNLSSELYVDRPTVSNWKSVLRIHDTYTIGTHVVPVTSKWQHTKTKMKMKKTKQKQKYYHTLDKLNRKQRWNIEKVRWMRRHNARLHYLADLSNDAIK